MKLAAEHLLLWKAKSLHEQQLQPLLLDERTCFVCCCCWQQGHLLCNDEDDDLTDDKLEQLITEEADEQVEAGEGSNEPLMAANCLGFELCE